jgi:hypothetical protein
MDTSAEPTPAAGPRAASARISGRRDNASARVGPKAAHGLEQLLTRGLAVGYQPRLPIYSSRFGDQLFFNFFNDVEWMCRDDSIRLPLQFVMGPAAHAEWGVEGRTNAEALFVAQQLQWFWSNAVPRVQGKGYPFGYCGGEMTYDVHEGMLVQSRFKIFNPRDTDPARHPDDQEAVRGVGPQHGRGGDQAARLGGRTSPTRRSGTPTWTTTTGCGASRRSGPPTGRGSG